MKALEGRINALERARRQPLPVYAVTQKNGLQRRADALDMVLHMARVQAGAEDPFEGVAMISGTLPASGSAWKELLTEISNIR